MMRIGSCCVKRILHLALEASIDIDFCSLSYRVHPEPIIIPSLMDPLSILAPLPLWLWPKKTL